MEKYIFDLSCEETLTRQVYVIFGLAIYLGQVFEKSLVTVLQAFAFAEGIQKKKSVEYFEIELAKVQSQMVGPLLKIIKKVAKFSDHEISKVTLAHEKRNYLVHNYFWDAAAKMYFEEGS